MAEYHFCLLPQGNYWFGFNHCFSWLVALTWRLLARGIDLTNHLVFYFSGASAPFFCYGLQELATHNIVVASMGLTLVLTIALAMAISTWYLRLRLTLMTFLNIFWWQQNSIMTSQEVKLSLMCSQSSLVASQCSECSVNGYLQVVKLHWHATAGHSIS